MTVAPQPAEETAASERPLTRALRVIVIATALLIAAVGARISLSALRGTEVWSHLRAGLWMVQNHAVPHTGLFSQDLNRHWSDHSWGFDMLLGLSYQALGLRAVVAVTMILYLAIALAFFRLGQGARRDVWLPALLTAIAQYALWGQELSPTLCSVVMFAIELMLLFRARRAADARSLRWLPLLFMVWANLDPQFVYGLLVLVLLLLSLIAERIVTRPPDALPASQTAMCTVASALAPLLNPYGCHVYAAAFRNFRPSPLSPYLPELNAVPFRRPQEFVLLLLTMAAFFAVGRRRAHTILPFALLLVTALLAYPSQTKTWLILVSAVAVIGDAVPAPATREAAERFTARQMLVAVGVAFAAVVGLIVVMPSNERLLSVEVAQSLPVRACDFVRTSRAAAPLFTTYEWGGFVTWYLPQYPVNIDSRTDLFGEEDTLRYFQAVHGEIPLWQDLGFVAARSLVLPRNLPMAVALSTVPQFKVAHSDDLGIVLVKQEP